MENQYVPKEVNFIKQRIPKITILLCVPKLNSDSEMKHQRTYAHILGSGTSKIFKLILIIGSRLKSN